MQLITIKIEKKEPRSVLMAEFAAFILDPPPRSGK
jgi:hypothetical protein